MANRILQIIAASLGFIIGVGLPPNRCTAHAISKPSRPTNLKFDFGFGQVAPGHTQVLETSIYNRELGYGFEPGSRVWCVNRGGRDTLRADLCRSDQPFFFSVALPEGNYQVTIIFGDQSAETTTTVKAELRRLMLEEIHTTPGKFTTRSFTVNIRVPQISTGGEVKLKDREKTSELWAWDEKLTLEFNNRRPAVCAIEITKVRVPTLYLLGDSTVSDQPLEPFNSWGQMLPRFFKPGIAVANYAQSGESLRSSLGAKRLDKVLSLIRPGDYLFIQFGHNDEKEKGEGVGAFTTYKASLKHFVAEARRRGGTPVLITPVQRRTFDAQGKISNSHGDYPEAVRQAAKEKHVPLIDLHAMSTALYEAWGPEASKRSFAPNDGTHHNNYGSYELARCIVEGIKANNPGLARYLMKDLAAFDPSHPDPIDNFKLPASPESTKIKPPGS